MSENILKNKENIYKNKDNYENVIIIAPLSEDFDKDEICSLCDTAGAIVKNIFTQKIREINPATYVGYGKLDEVKNYLSENEIDGVVFDGDLSPSQTINISDYLDVKVIDRTTLILDIFAKNAISGEGKLQVELAQLKRLYPRLKGKGSALSKLGGGIGTRGPGETKLETDRRHIRTRINYLEKSLERLKNVKDLQNNSRKRSGDIVIALVGYTNAGKSTLMNLLTGSNVLAQNKLFATLDTKTSLLRLDSFDALLIDTVGFVKNIPTTIIDAFKSTLSASINADLILNVCDLSSDYDKQLKVTSKILEELCCETDKIINVYNKCDVIGETFVNGVVISAKTGYGIDNLKNKIEQMLKDRFCFPKIKIPIEKYPLFLSLKKYCVRTREEFSESNVELDLVIKKENISKFNVLY